VSVSACLRVCVSVCVRLTCAQVECVLVCVRVRVRVCVCVGLCALLLRERDHRSAGLAISMRVCVQKSKQRDRTPDRGNRCRVVGAF
jgi:hypothetical protein